MPRPGTGAELIELHCDAPIELVRARIDERLHLGVDASEASVNAADAMRARIDPWPEAARLETREPIEQVVSAALNHVC